MSTDVNRNPDRDMGTNELVPLEACLRLLGQTCRVAVPFPRLSVVSTWPIAPPQTKLNAQSLPLMTVAVLQGLIDLVHADADIEQLVWSPLAAHTRRIPAAVVYGFQEKLCQWKSKRNHLLPELDSESTLENLIQYKWEKFPIPPPGYSTVTPRACLTAAHYSFYMARMKWALCLLGEDTTRNEVSANFYFYEAMRFATTHASGTIKVRDLEDSYVPCEAVKAGFLPLLHITGLCSPRPSWLRWIQTLCEHIEQEGVLKGHTFSTNLGCLHTFEMYNEGDSPAMIERYSNPANRVICQLIPETDGRHYISYFARPMLESNPGSDGLAAYQPLGQARWRCYFGEHPCNAEIQIYDEDRIGMEPFSTNWLLTKLAAVDWMTWSTYAEFNLDHALRNHINGTRLLPPPDEMQSLA
jgi:hypothetical protein